MNLGKNIVNDVNGLIFILVSNKTNKFTTGELALRKSLI